MSKIVTGILAHVDAGKTTLSESMLYLSGSIRKMGRVDNRDAFLDTYALEKERGITIFSKQAEIRLGDQAFTLLDTPGHVGSEMCIRDSTGTCGFFGRDGKNLAGARLRDSGYQRCRWCAGTYADIVAFIKKIPYTCIYFCE